MKLKGPRNETVRQAIMLLEKASKKDKKGLWKDIAKRLGKSRRGRASVNLWKLASVGNDKKFLLVPGKVLGFGQLDKAVNVIALEFSENAKKKIAEKGKALSIEEAMKQDIKASEVSIVC